MSLINLKVFNDKQQTTSINPALFKRPKFLGVGYLLKMKTLLGLSSKDFFKFDLIHLQKSHSKRYLDWNTFLLQQANLSSSYSQEISIKKELLIKNEFYKGIRYKLSLPVRGQRTHTNAQTARRLLKQK